MRIYVRPTYPLFQLGIDDPIRAAQLRDEYHEYVDRLFEPIDQDLQERPMDYLVEGLLPKGYLAILASAPKQGKTCLATALALAVATGTPFAGMPTQQSTVLWLSMEESRSERWLLLRQSRLSDPATPLYTSYEYLPIDQEDVIELLADWINRTQARLIIVDSLHAASSGRSLNDGWNARKTLQRLKHFCGTYGITALVLHHAKDLSRTGAPRVAENDQIAATASMSMVLAQTEGRGPKSTDQSYRIVTLYCSGRGDFANRKLTFLSKAPLDYQVFNEMPEPRKKVELRYQDEEAIVEFLKGRPKTAGQIGDTLRLTDNQLRNCLTRLRQKGLVTLVKSDRRPRKYKLCGGLHLNAQEKSDSI